MGNLRVSPAAFLVLLLLTILASACRREEEPLDAERFPLLPRPAHVEPKDGAFSLTAGTRLVLSPANDQELRAMVDRWASPIRQASGLALPIADREDQGVQGALRIVLRPPEPGDEAPVPAGEGLPGTEAEAYELSVEPDAIDLEASGRAGLFYGLETVSQLIPGLRANPGEQAPADARERSAGPVTAPWSVPAVEIKDRPRFPYRGMHLDVGRHFFPVAFIKRYIDLLATYRMNAFHWHLTEDQGWRLEIQRYPRLTEIGSCRAETMVEKNFAPYVGDGTRYCGYYTQEEAREIVAYARERFITVIPEIEMPGHSVAALAAYPQLACTPGPFEVFTRWGVTDDIYCPTEETFTFLENVLDEVMDIFPSPYIHIGGDEAPKARWEESAVAQQVIEREGLADEGELQSWFIRRIEQYLNQHGRRLIGWDEILEGGVAPNATVMSWRGTAGGVEAARQGHDVIMTPNSHLYLDYYQGDTIQEPLAIGGYSPLDKVYGYEPIPEALSAEEARHVLGAQGNVWTEYMATTSHVEYMVLPRLLALSEVVWTPRDRRSWSSFMSRLPAHLARLAARGVNFRIPDVMGLEEDRLTLTDSALVELSAPIRDGVIHYTLDGTDPGPLSPTYEDAFTIPVDETGTEVTARVVLNDGRAGASKQARYRRTTFMAPVPVPLASRRAGLSARMFTGRYRSVGEVGLDTERDTAETGRARAAGAGDAVGGEAGAAMRAETSPRMTTETEVPRVCLPGEVPGRAFGMLLEGFVRVPRKGIYTFTLASDDGSRLTVGDRLVIDHDGAHGMSSLSGKVALHRGWHPIEVGYFQAGGGSGLRLEIEGPGMPRREVPATWLAHFPGQEGP